MQPSGLAAIEVAKQAGLWDATTKVDAFVVPKDLAAALKKNKTALQFFNSAAPSYRRNVLRWIFNAKTEPTRIKRIVATMEVSGRLEKIPQL